jgi:hypothetical protein
MPISRDRGDPAKRYIISIFKPPVQGTACRRSTGSVTGDLVARAIKNFAQANSILEYARRRIAWCICCTGLKGDPDEPRARVSTPSTG